MSNRVAPDPDSQAGQSPEPTVIRDRFHLDAQLRKISGNLGLVLVSETPTAATRDLIDQAIASCDNVLVTGFGIGPEAAAARFDTEATVAWLTSQGWGGELLIFAPSAQTLYPHGLPQVQIRTGQLGEVFEGQVRPGHYDWLAQVFAKLLNLTTAERVFHPQYDAQGVAVLRQLVRDLDYLTEVVATPIKRTWNGVAITDGTAGLDESSLAVAARLDAALRRGIQAAATSGLAQDVLDAAAAVLADAPELEVDYVAVVDPMTLQPVLSDCAGTALLLIGAWLGPVRLCDNALVVLGHSRQW